MNKIEGKILLKGSEKIAIICSRFNHIITDRLIEGAQDSFLRHGGNAKNLDLILPIAVLNPECKHSVCPFPRSLAAT